MGICDNFLFTTSYHEGIGGIHPTWCKFAKIHPKYWWIWWPSQFCSPTPYYCQIFFSGDQNIDEADVKSFSFVWLMYQRDGRDIETVKWGKSENIQIFVAHSASRIISTCIIDILNKNLHNQGSTAGKMWQTSSSGQQDKAQGARISIIWRWCWAQYTSALLGDWMLIDNFCQKESCKKVFLQNLLRTIHICRLVQANDVAETKFFIRWVPSLLVLVPWELMAMTVMTRIWSTSLLVDNNN